jgi:tetratricopeptide (TPR) repeat protein
MVKVILISIVKNEEKIIERMIKSALPILDGICITDTGSSDNTVLKIENIINEFDIPGKVYIDEWKNFGYNRSNSFLNGVKFCEEQQWNPNEVYGLLLDADMQLVILPNFSKNMLTSNGYKIIQQSSSLDYYNTRFLKMGHTWRCLGVTHEYWDGSNSDTITKEFVYINDIGDGGSKGDKFERDVRLLEQGITEEPNNERYHFYLAQSYKDSCNFKKAIELYKKRIKMGGWFEEVWYSHYMISKLWMLLNNEEKFELWALRAYKLKNNRVEPIYALCKYFREKSQHFKALHYYQIGKKIQYPNEDLLFIEKDVYTWLFDYEYTILQYYVYHNERLEGLKSSIKFLNKYPQHENMVFSNIDFYMDRMTSNGRMIKLDVDNDGDFIPSSTSLLKIDDNRILANVRFVNYRIQPNGGYLMSKNGVLDPNEKVKTKNAFMYFNDKMEPISELTFMDTNLTDLPARDVHILGLEDVRLYTLNNKIYYTATSLQYSYTNNIRIVKGEYDITTKKFINNMSLKPPTETSCEKNWIAIEDKFIYKWHPLEIGILIDNKLEILNSIETPNFFRHYRGSSNVVEYNNQFWVVTHGIKNCVPRKYFHQIVILDKKDYKVKKYTVPFFYDKLMIEYTLGLVIVNETLFITASRNDSKPIIVELKIKDLQKYFM